MEMRDIKKRLASLEKDVKILKSMRILDRECKSCGTIIMDLGEEFCWRCKSVRRLKSE